MVRACLLAVALLACERRSLVLAYAQLPCAEALAAIERIAQQFPKITDSFGTNSHYAKSVLELMDIVVVGVVDE